MVKNGQDILPVGFRSSVHPSLPVEVISRSQVLDRAGPDHFALPQRLSFDCFVLAGSHGWHQTVDFVDIPTRPGRLVRVRAGQVQSLDQHPTVEATVVLSAPGTSTLQPWFPGDPAFTDLDEQALTTAVALIRALDQYQRRFDGQATTVRLMVALFESLAALFDQSAGGIGNDGPSPIYVEFRTALERELSRRRDVAYYARLLGYSERTVTRACLKATGQTAKQVLIDRLVLEAKRLLVQTDDPVTAISSQIGFSEPTNFTKFFVRHGGTTPSDFRRRRTAGQPQVESE